MIANQAVMRHMRPDHKQAIIPYLRQHTATFGAGIDGHMFPDRAVFADHQLRFFSVIFKILRGMTNGGEGINDRSLADAGPARNRHMRLKGDACLQRDLAADHTKGTDRRLRMDRCALFYNRGLMNIAHWPPVFLLTRYNLRHS
nr:hypothetical protein [Sneathiella sp.]